MLGYLAVLLVGFWLGVAIFLYVSCYWLDEILDLPNRSSQPAPSTSASSAHAQLKRLVARVVEEAASLPALAHYAAEPPRAPSVEGAAYEDLLATAILNKVIERYQNESGSGGRSSGIHSASASPTPSERSSPRDLRTRHRDATPPLLEEDEEGSEWGGEELPRRVPFPEFGGDIVHATDNDDRDFDEVSGSDIQATDGTWEENWLFQKKKIKSLQSVPVPMLVPNSNTDYRAMIGDRDADDTTDLSDNATDNEEELEYKSDVKRILDSKHVIGGKAKVEEILDFEPDSLTIIDDVNDATNDEIDGTVVVDKVETVNGVLKEDSVLVVGMDSGPLDKPEFTVKEEIHRTFMKANGLVPIGTLDKESLQSNKDFRNNTLNGHEREGEYEETVTVPVQRYADSLRRKHFDDEPQTIPTRDTETDEDLIPGSIADRERKKWLNYVEMPNNPYSPEAIQKRLSAKSTSSLFDMITKGNIDEPLHKENGIKENGKDNSVKENGFIEKEMSLSSESGEELNGIASDAPKTMKDVLSEDLPQFKRYDRDYYIKEAKQSCGGRKRGNLSETSSVSSFHKSCSLDNLSNETGSLIQQFNTIASNQEYMKFAEKNKRNYTTITMITSNDVNPLIEYEDIQQSLYEAQPATIDDDTDSKIQEIINSAYSSEPSSLNVEIETKSDELSPKSPQDSIISSSSLDDSIKIYNVPTGEIVKNKLTDSVSQRYVDKNDNIDIPDKNLASRQDAAASMPVIVEEILRENQIENITEVEEVLPKVKELAKKFVSMDNLIEETAAPLNLPIPKEPITKRRKSRENILEDMKDQSTKHLYMHSLTARSISKEFRQELKLSMATPMKFPGGTNEVPEGIEEVVKESSRPGSPLPEPGNLKSKLAFFESLKSRFSTK